MYYTQVSVKMCRNGDLVEAVKLLELSTIADGLEIYISDEPFAVAYNEPWISLIELPESILATCYVYPSKLEMQCSNPDETIFTWHRGKKVNLIFYILKMKTL